MGLQAKAIMFKKKAFKKKRKHFGCFFFCPVKETTEGGKQFYVEKNTTKATNVTIGVCTVQL